MKFVKIRKMKVKLLCSYIKTQEEYNALFDELIKKETDFWEEQTNLTMANPSDEDLSKMKKALVEAHKADFNEEEINDVHIGLHVLNSVVTPLAVKDLFDAKREETIKRWLKEDQDKEEKILKAKPLEDIKCSKCKTDMKYLQSDLYDRGSSNEPDEQAMFFYECPKDGERKIFFENGDPWIVESKKAA